MYDGIGIESRRLRFFPPLHSIQSATISELPQKQQETSFFLSSRHSSLFSFRFGHPYMMPALFFQPLLLVCIGQLIYSIKFAHPLLLCLHFSDPLSCEFGRNEWKPPFRKANIHCNSCSPSADTVVAVVVAVDRGLRTAQTAIDM